MLHRFIRVALLATLLLLLAAPLALAGGDAKGASDQAKRKPDNRTTAADVKMQKRLQRGLDAKLAGKAHDKTYQVARGQFVQLQREGTGQIWTVLGEFADLKHNQIPQPNRAVDNTTIWRSDFNRAYYNDLLFNAVPGANSMLNFYLEQSSGRFGVAGDTTEWVGVPGNAATYNDDLGGPAVWQFLQDSINGWYQAQVAAGKTSTQIDADLGQFDQTDRYDYDGDGNFNEPDGYIDTFQSVHAGEGEEGGAPSWAIWSHSWYAYSNLAGVAGPGFNKLGGVQIGTSKYWVGKYTIQPENGGLGVFAHEFGHDLGLPDLYDTAGSGDNSWGFWTLMDSGSWLSDSATDIGSKPSHMGAWEKFQLGWLNYQVASVGKNQSVKLGPMETNTKQAQGLFVILPKKHVTTVIGTPFAGANMYYSGSGDDMDNLMYKPVTLPASPSLTAKINYDIELDWDYAYVVVSTDGGATWKSVPTNLSTTTDPNGQNYGYGITGWSNGSWVDLNADLSAYGNQWVFLGFRYWTDGAATYPGVMLDEIAINGGAPDGAETPNGWTYKPAAGGFRVSTGTESALYSNYYVAEFRQYRGYDNVLKVGPYYFGYGAPKPNYVDHFPYQDGLLVGYWDTSQNDNNTSVHPGAGLVLPVDAHPTALRRTDGAIWRNRIQSYDSTFGLEATDPLNLHVNGVVSPIPSLAAVPVFDDTLQWYDAANPTASVKTPTTNTQIRVVSYSALDNFLQLQVRPAK